MSLNNLITFSLAADNASNAPHCLILFCTVHSNIKPAAPITHCKIFYCKNWLFKPGNKIVCIRDMSASPQVQEQWNLISLRAIWRQPTTVANAFYVQTNEHAKEEYYVHFQSIYQCFPNASCAALRAKTHTYT